MEWRGWGVLQRLFWGCAEVVSWHSPPPRGGRQSTQMQPPDLHTVPLVPCQAPLGCPGLRLPFGNV